MPNVYVYFAPVFCIYEPHKELYNICVLYTIYDRNEVHSITWAIISHNRYACNEIQMSRRTTRPVKEEHIYWDSSFEYKYMCA